MNALVFDCDGVLADTERDGHLPAFNATFAEFGLPFRWSEAEYAEKLRIGGGKERVASVLTPDIMQSMGIVGDAERAAFVAKLHAAKTEAFKAIVASGKLPGRPGIARLARAMHERGWRLAVASTSAESSVRAVLESVVGAELAREFEIFAGDIVPHKKPAPDIYELAVARLGVKKGETLVVEDSRNGLLAAAAAGLACIVTLSSFTQDEPMDEALLVVSSLGEPDGVVTKVLANRSGAQIGSYVSADDLSAFLALDAVEASPAAVAQIEFAIRSMAKTAIENERYFGELDAVVGDGDLGESLARGFEAILADLDTFDRTSGGAFLKKVGLTVTSKIGGTSGPLWGTAVLRAASVAGERESLSRQDVKAMLEAAAEGIMQRGRSACGDKTLLDVLVPVASALDGPEEPNMQTFERIADVATASCEETKTMVAKRGRASYSGDRSIGSVDAGAAAITRIIVDLRDAYRAREESIR